MGTAKSTAMCAGTAMGTVKGTAMGTAMYAGTAMGTAVGTAICAGTAMGTGFVKGISMVTAIGNDGNDKSAVEGNDKVLPTFTSAAEIKPIVEHAADKNKTASEGAWYPERFSPCGERRAWR